MNDFQNLFVEEFFCLLIPRIFYIKIKNKKMREKKDLKQLLERKLKRNL